jgi:hypothetical protein
MAKLSLFLAALFAATAATASQPGYHLDLNAERSGSQLTVNPIIEAPPGDELRYELVSTKVGPSGSANNSQSGQVTVGPDGSARLSSLSLGVGPDDRYTVNVKVFSGETLVAEGLLEHPR